MDSECETTNPEIRTRLAHRNGFLCVVAERGSPEGPDPTTLKVWYPIREAEEAEVQMLLGRPVIEVDPKEGIYVDEEGTVFQLAEKGETKPVLVEEIPNESGELEQLLATSLKNGNSSGRARTHALQRSTGRRKKGARETNGSAKPSTDQCPGTAIGTQESLLARDWEHAATQESTRLNLRQKLAEVRRRIGYVQKRGFNERNNYSYVTAADLAGAVGDILAELGGVIIPPRESITYEPTAGARAIIA